MKPRYQVSKAAIELIKSFEGFRKTAARLADGRWTIGYGHTLSAREGTEVSREDAEALLIYDLMAIAASVNTLTFSPLSQNQFDGLCAFVYNIGVDAFQGSDVLKNINEGRLLQAACAMELWRRADFQGSSLIIDAIVRRRAAEKTLFLTPDSGWVPVPSAILRPTLDVDTLGQVPRLPPTDLKALLEGREAIVEQDDAPMLSALSASASETVGLETAPVEAATTLWPPLPRDQDRDQDRITVTEAGSGPDVTQDPDLAETSRDTFGLRLEQLAEPSPGIGWTISDRPKINLRPILSVFVLALILTVSGVYWSGHGNIGSGLFHPLLVGGLVCLLGLGGLALAAYLFLVDLGYIEPFHDSRADRI